MQVFSSVMQKLVDVREFSFRVEIKRENNACRQFPDSGSQYFYQVVAKSVNSCIDVIMWMFSDPENAFDYLDRMYEMFSLHRSVDDLSDLTGGDLV